MLATSHPFVIEKCHARGLKHAAKKAAKIVEEGGIAIGVIWDVTDEAQAAVLWLCSHGASFVVGVRLPMDGGFTAH
nr:hypothetical protein [uncultured Steroidobacter sp.]